jgi:bifunctional non-homologous end joining protein LigD
MNSRYVIHRHKTGRTHFDLRIILEEKLRSWSLLKEPPRKSGERRLAIERENFPIESLNSENWEEEAFGKGSANIWDKGQVEIQAPSSRLMLLTFRGHKLSGKYELRRMVWYPGNRWLLTKSPTSGDRANLP